MQTLFILFQRLLPQHLLSRLVGALAKSELAMIRGVFIRAFCLFYNVNLEEARRTSIEEYRSFNDFFTRSLKDGARSINGVLCSPADGTVAAFGNITDDTLIQSKGHQYSLSKLLAESQTKQFETGSFITIYLAPHNYHRVHTPCTGELRRAKYIPGKLFSVNQITTRHLPNLFTNNERLVCRFTTENGAVMVVMVGAMLVAGIKPVWLERTYQPKLLIETEMNQQFSQGDELGQFQMGSTVILVFDHRIDFAVRAGQPIRYGEPLT